MAHNRNGLARVLGSLAPPVATGVGYYVAAIASLLLTRGADGIATIWPPAGILLAALLAVPRRRAGWHIVAAFVASLGANLGSGNTLLISIGFGAANTLGPAVAAWLIRTRSSEDLSFTEFAGVTRFCMAAFMGAALSATIAASMSPARSTDFWFSWFSTNLLGALVTTPLILIVYDAFTSSGPEAKRKAARRITAVFGMVALVTVLCFGQSSYPLLFLPMLAVIIGAFRLGPLGAAGGVLIVSIIGSGAIGLGSGPLPPVASPLVQSLFLQFYLLTLFAAALPIAALLAARERIALRLSEKMRLLQLAESAAHFGHWRLDIAAQTVSWSQEVFRIHGLETGSSPSLQQALDAYHIEDRAGVTAHIQRSIEHRKAFEFIARIVRPDGEIRQVFSQGEIDGVANDGSFGLFGIVQDITAQIVHEAAMDNARIRAEEAAREATAMAETDQLTGIANRRRTTLALEQAIAAAQRSGDPLSVAMFDVDHFKRVNDTYGHQAGDAVLQRIAADAHGELRNGDTVGRFGGEEFVIVLPEATAQAALLVAERIRVAIEAGGDDPRVTISMGVAELATGEAGYEVLRRADQALYVAKREGRNTLRLAA